jgi:hypothetical protein
MNAKHRSIGIVVLVLSFSIGYAMAAPNPLAIKTQFFYENDNKEVTALNNDSVLRSGQHVGVAFRPQEDCYIYIFWVDSAGKMGALFPNSKITEGSAQTQAGKTYWLPRKDGERWYVLDDTPGTETIYFVVSRNRSPELEALNATAMNQQSPSTISDAQSTGSAQQSQVGQPPSSVRPEAAQKIQQKLGLMGFAEYSISKGAERASFPNGEDMFKSIESHIRVSGAEAVFKIVFRHDQ